MKVNMDNISDGKTSKKSKSKENPLLKSKLFGKKETEQEKPVTEVNEEITEVEEESDVEPEAEEKSADNIIAEESSEEEGIADDDEKASDNGLTATPAGSGNVYIEGLKAYRDKFKQANVFQTNKFWIIVIIILFFVFISTNSNVSSTKNQLTVKLNKAVTKTATYTGAIDDIKQQLEEDARIEAAQLTQEQEELAKNDAKVQGAQVAYLQNKYATVTVPDQNKYKEESEYKTAMNNYYEKVNNIKSELGQYFDSDAQAKGKSAWYAYSSILPGTWEFATNASFSGDTSKVLWLCYSSDTGDHSLLAYCTATYNATTQVFSNIVIKTTTYTETTAAKLTATEATNNDETSIVDSVNSIVDEINSLDSIVDTVTPTYEESDTWDNGVSDGRDAYKDMVENGQITDTDSSSDNNDVSASSSNSDDVSTNSSSSSDSTSDSKSTQ